MPTKTKKAKSLRIAVCLKPVPDPAKWDRLKLDPNTMLLNRAELPAVINSLDLNAIEEALRIKAENGGEVVAMTMAPPEAESQLREALAMGCDRAFLLSDRAFAGSDTLATARCLAAAVEKIGGLDLVFCGAYSLDGSTSQVGPQLAELLSFPELCRVVRLEIGDGVARAECREEAGSIVMEAELPALVTFDREANAPRLPTMAGICASAGIEVGRWNAADLGLDAESVGLAGSPTRMLNVFAPALGRKGEMIQGTASEMAEELVARLRSNKSIA
jgi:electron transfer flavoprotein beta subunit